jgi:iron complex outermembrane receptor protein
MAGVINIILRKDYSGLNLRYEIGRPSQSGGDDDSYSMTGGVSSAKGNVTFSMEASSQDIVYYRDRDFTAGQLPFEGLSADGFPASYRAYLDWEDPRNPTGYELSFGRFPDPRCPEELYTDPAYPWSGNYEGWDGYICAYGWWGESAHEAAYDTKSFFVDASYEITDRLDFFASALFTSSEISTVWAPFETRLHMSPSAPQNPTNPDNPTNYLGDAFGGQSAEIDTDGDGEPDTTIEGPFDVEVRYRNVPAGNRKRETRNTQIDYVAGVRGAVDWLGGADWELSAQWSENNSDTESEGEADVSSLQSAIDAGTFDLYGVFGPYADNVLDAAQRAAITVPLDAKYRLAGGDGQISFEAFQLDHGPVPVVLGFEYRDEDAEWDGADDGARVVKSVFAETAIPLLASLEVSVAGRYDDYNDFGTTLNPKLTLQFRPLDSLLLRSSYGTGFVAPDYDGLRSPSVGEWTSGYFIDSWGCSRTPEGGDNGRPVVDPDSLPGGHPCREEWRDRVWAAGNPDLQPEESDNWTVGLVWSPAPGLSVVLDYFDIQINGQIWEEDMQASLDDELAQRQSGQIGATVGRVTREPSGRIERLYWTSENVDKTSTDGIDAEARFSFGAGSAGDVSLGLVWTHVFHYKRDYRNGRGELDWAGHVGYPQDRGQLTVNWNLGDYAATIVGNYISDQDGHRTWSPNEGEHLASFTTWDVQASYLTPWNARITLGARNVFDRDPPLPNYYVVYEQGQHEVYGRVPYLRFELDF